MKINSAQEAAAVINKMSADKISMLVRGLKMQHLHLRNKTDAEVKQFLINYAASNA